MFKDNVKLGICQYSLPVEGPYALKIASEIGFDGVQLDLIKNFKGQLSITNNFVQKTFLELKDQYGIEFPSIAVRELDQHSILAEDNQVAMDAVNKAIIAASALKIPIVLVPNFGNSEIKTKGDFAKMKIVLKNACDLASEFGIIIATENLLSADEIERLINEVGSPNLKLYFDTQNHFLHRGYDMPEMLDRLIDYVCEVHVKDGKNKDLSGALLGRGDTGFYKSIEVLKKHNYSGWIISENYYDLEPLSLTNNNPVELIKEDFKILKEAVGRF